jgi:hypothetical protein
MPTELLIQLLQLVPAGLQAAAEISGQLSETDQARLDAALDAIKASELISFNKATADLDAAAKARPMGDDPHKKKQDGKLISLTEEHEVRYWTKKFSISQDELEEAVGAVGHSVKAVETTSSTRPLDRSATSPWKRGRAATPGPFL